MKSFLIFFLAISGVSVSGYSKNSRAEYNLPDFSKPLISVGRTFVYPSVKGILWINPTAFSVQFSCGDSTLGNDTICGLQVLNFLTAEERAEIAKLSKNGNQAIAFSDIDSSVVQHIQSSFEALSPNLANGKSVFMNTLNFDLKLPQASRLAHVSAKEAALLNSLFQSTGLGTYKTSYRVNGEAVYDYLRIEHTSCLVQSIKTLGTQSFVPVQLKSKVKAALADCTASMRMVVSDLTPEEATYLVFLNILKNHTNQARRGRFVLNQASLANIPDSWTLVNMTTTGLSKKCTSELTLQKDAVPVTKCEDLP